MRWHRVGANCETTALLEDGRTREDACCEMHPSISADAPREDRWAIGSVRPALAESQRIIGGPPLRAPSLPPSPQPRGAPIYTRQISARPPRRDRPRPIALGAGCDQPIRHGVWPTIKGRRARRDLLLRRTHRP